MDKCYWCGGFLSANLKIKFILSFQPFVPKLLCEKCKMLFKLPTEAGNCCDCGRFQDNNQRCHDCEKWLIRHNRLINHSFYPYHGIIKEYLERYKFKGDYRLRHLFQHHFAKLVQKDEIVIPIPITQKTMEKRHFNQVTGMLSEISYLECLKAKAKTQNQSDKGRLDRINMEQPFEINPQLVSQIRGQKVVLVDDVYTTGTTLHYAAQILKENGALSIRSITLAR